MAGADPLKVVTATETSTIDGQGRIVSGGQCVTSPFSHHWKTTKQLLSIGGNTVRKTIPK